MPVSPSDLRLSPLCPQSTFTRSQAPEKSSAPWLGGRPMGGPKFTRRATGVRKYSSKWHPDSVIASRTGLRCALLALVFASCQIPTQISRGGEPVVTVAVLPDLGPAPEKIPPDPVQVIDMRPGHPGLNELHTQFLASIGYIPGSERVDAIYVGAEGDLFIISWQSDEPAVGEGECRTAVSPDAVPTGWGCGGRSPVEARSIDGYSHTGGPGVQEVMVKHSPDAEATVIELADGDTFVIFTNGASVSFHRWDGPQPIRFTIFWDDGTRTSEVLTT